MTSSSCPTASARWALQGQAGWGGTRGLPLPLTPTPSLHCVQAITARDSMAKSLYSALFDWIVLRINHALLNKKDMEEAVSVRMPPRP